MVQQQLVKKEIAPNGSGILCYIQLKYMHLSDLYDRFRKHLELIKKIANGLNWLGPIKSIAFLLMQSWKDLIFFIVSFFL